MFLNKFHDSDFTTYPSWIRYLKHFKTIRIAFYAYISLDFRFKRSFFTRKDLETFEEHFKPIRIVIPLKKENLAFLRCVLLFSKGEGTRKKKFFFFQKFLYQSGLTIYLK